MSTRTTWIGVAGNATAKVSVGYTLGNTQQYVHLYNCENPQSLQTPCTISGSLSGLALHAGLGTSVAVVTGVHHKNQLEGLTSSGWDFAIDVGGRAGEAAKATVRSPSLFRAVIQAFKSNSLAQWLASEAGKSAVNGYTGDLSLGNGSPSFAVWGTPVGAGLGGGVWYENQTLHLTGTKRAWDNAQLNWRLIKHGGTLWLQIQGVPEEDGAILVVTGKQFHSMYPDGFVRLGQPGSKRMGDATVVVRGGRIHETDTAARFAGTPPPDGGINLSARSIDYVANFPYEANKFIEKDDYMRLGFAIRKDKKLVWESGDATRVHFSYLTVQHVSGRHTPGTRRMDKTEPHYWTQ